MDEDKNKNARSVNWLQIFSGISFFLIGVMIYIIDRPPEDTYFFNHYKFIKTLHNTLPALFGPLGNFLPDYIHPLSFILITSGIVSCGKKGYRIICISWLVIDCTFELGQKYSTLFIKAVPDWFAGVPFLEAFEIYFKRGTFDPYDIAAIFAGTITAYYILVLTMKR